jgi:hypothetical protein
MDKVRSLLNLRHCRGEVLRLYVNVCVMVSSPHSDVSLGRWRLPKGAAALVSSGMMHMDESYWNTRDGLHPVRSFWADRFLTYPLDVSDGPVAPMVRDSPSPGTPRKEGEPTVSLKDLEASWMPYGGKSSLLRT